MLSRLDEIVKYYNLKLFYSFDIKSKNFRNRVQCHMILQKSFSFADLLLSVLKTLANNYFFPGFFDLYKVQQNCINLKQIFFVTM